MATELGMPSLAQASSLVLAKLADLTGDPEAAVTRLRDVLDQSTGDVDVEMAAFHQLAMVHFGVGEFSEAKRFFLQSAGRAKAARRPWTPWGLDARAMAALSAYILGDWDEVLELTDTTGEAPPPLVEAYLRSVALDVEAGRALPDGLEHVAAIRPAWELDGAMVLYCTTAAIDLYGDRGEVEA